MNLFTAVGRIVSSSTNLIVKAVEGTEGYIGAYAAVGNYAEEVVNSSIDDLKEESAARRAEIKE